MARTVPRGDPRARLCYGRFHRFLRVPKGYEKVPLEKTPFVAPDLKIDKPGTLADAIEMAMFAVDHYNRTQKAKLVFEQLFKSTCQWVEGAMFHLTFSARSRSATQNESKIYEVMGWLKHCSTRKVILFQESSQEGFDTVPATLEAATEMAMLAIEFYNLDMDVDLVFDKLIEATSQVVYGVMYYVTFRARSATQIGSEIYKAEVWQMTTGKKEVILVEKSYEEGVGHQMSHLSTSISSDTSDPSEHSDESDPGMDLCSEDDPSEKSDESDQEM